MSVGSRRRRTRIFVRGPRVIYLRVSLLYARGGLALSRAETRVSPTILRNALANFRGLSGATLRPRGNSDVSPFITRVSGVCECIVRPRCSAIRARWRRAEGVGRARALFPSREGKREPAFTCIIKETCKSCRSRISFSTRQNALKAMAKHQVATYICRSEISPKGKGKKIQPGR